jgi:hypothetical protein
MGKKSCDDRTTLVARGAQNSDDLLGGHFDGLFG